MDWQDNGIVIGVRRHGETSVILDLLTSQRGRHLGYVHGGRSRRMRPCLQPGNSVEASWRSRIEEQLGTFSVEPRLQRAARIMDSALALHGLNHLCALVRLLPEREPHPVLHDRLESILDRLDDPIDTPAAVVRFELSILRELGFGLDLDRCAATGVSKDLVYVSPKSGRAVSRAAGAPYQERLLVLPAFLVAESPDANRQDIAAGFRLAEHFLLRDVLAPRGIAVSLARNAYVRAVT